MSKSSLTASKAKKILEDGTVHGKPLTAKQKKFFGSVSKGETPIRSVKRNIKRKVKRR